MEIFDVAIAGAGPAGSTCAAFCAQAGLRVVLLERERFPREKVCGDCLNPACWPALERLGVAKEIRALPHGSLDSVEFIAIDGSSTQVDLPFGDDAEIAIKRSLFDNLLFKRAHALGVDVRDGVTVRTVESKGAQEWNVEAAGQKIAATVLVGADGRNSTVARLCGLLPKSKRERVALQTHLPLPGNFGNRIVLQFRPEGYSGQAPVGSDQLNLCLVGTPAGIDTLKQWAMERFAVAADHAWRTITPLTRAPLPPSHQNLFFIGDAARVVEPFTGEGIYYAIKSGELAARAIVKIIRDANPPSAVREFREEHAAMYRGRLWINRLARAAVLSPRIGSLLVHAARVQPALLRLLTGKIVR